MVDEMKKNWNKNIIQKHLTREEQRRQYYGFVAHQNDYGTLDYNPVDVKRLFRSDGLIHMYR